MSETTKLRNWIYRVADEGREATYRWLDAVDKLAAGTYEPKHALSDWYYFMSRGIIFLPDLPAAGVQPPLLLLEVNLGQDTAAETRLLLGKATTPVVSDLVNVADSSKTIGAATFTPTLHNGGTKLLVQATGLSGLTLVRGERYSGQVTEGTATLARLDLKVLGPLT